MKRVFSFMTRCCLWFDSCSHGSSGIVSAHNPERGFCCCQPSTILEKYFLHTSAFTLFAQSWITGEKLALLSLDKVGLLLKLWLTWWMDQPVVNLVDRAHMASEATLEDFTWLQIMVKIAFGKLCFVRVIGSLLVRIQLVAQRWKIQPQGWCVKAESSRVTLCKRDRYPSCKILLQKACLPQDTTSLEMGAQMAGKHY